jgi:release factor glutamine methyltransferase
VPGDALHLLPSDVRSFEPRRALDGGAGGLDVLRRLVADAARLLRPGGWLLTEAGGEQDRSLAPVLAAHAFEGATTWRDAEGDLRGLAARRS